MSTKSERLVILLSKEEKARIADHAKRRNVSMGELARGALLSSASGDSSRPDTPSGLRRHLAAAEERTAYAYGERQGDDDMNAQSAPIEISAEQAQTLEELADAAIQSMERANASLDRAFRELEATKEYFDTKRSNDLFEDILDELTADNRTIRADR